MTIETVQLERMKLIMLQYISRQLADDLAMQPELEVSMYSSIADELALRLKQEVYGRQLEHISARYPDDWWQAFKERWFPAWAKKHWPIQYAEIHLEAKELYPKMAALGRGPVLWMRIWGKNGD